jgi:uncharacterized protein YbaP (TraB family)
MFRLFAITALCLVALSPAAGAECVGRNLLDDLPEDERAALYERSHAEPFAQGNFWRAVKGDQAITLIGTYHMTDPRHDATMARLAPVLDAASTVLVEAGPKEMTALKEQLGKQPELMVITDGPTLPEQLDAATWDKLSAALRLRGVPPFMAAKMQPWYLSMMLSIPPCAMDAMGEDRGLDAQVIEAAESRGLPILALEPYDTIFSIFGDMKKTDQLSMVTASLALEDKSEDMSVTMAEAYFAEEPRLIWEFSRAQALALEEADPEKVAAEFAVMEDAMMTRRNQAWIPVLTKAAEDGPVLAAFGALHLSGRNGVLALLQAEGFTIERLSFR